MFVREDWTLFRTLGTLPQKAGVPVDLIRRLVAKELADNALDAAGTCEVGTLADGGFYVQDQGPGLEPDQLATMFSIKRPLMSSKLKRLPSRGALGNGLRVVAGAVLASGGSLRVLSKGLCLELAPQDTGETIVAASGPCEWNVGTRIEVRLGGSIPYDEHELQWARTAIALADGGEHYKGKPSAWWFDADAFFELFQAATSMSVRDLVETLDGCSGKKAGTVAAEFLGRSAASLDRAGTTAILLRAREHSRQVNPDRLGGVGQTPRLGGAYARATGTLELAPGRDDVAAVLPFVVEAWVRLLSEGQRDRVSACVNRTPVAGKLDIWRYGKKAEVALSGLGLARVLEVGTNPVEIVINLTTPYMPITSDGKAPDLGRFIGAIAEAVTMGAKRSRRASAALRPQQVKVSQKDVILASLEAAIAQAGGNGEYRYSQRQLFYAVRPFILEACGKEPDYNYFCQVITDFEAERGELAGLYRDARGVLYHPHTGEDIPLGTLNVEKYQRPDWIFNKVLYSEKEGFFEILKAIKWPEQHDCALMTSKGYASRAARDLIDLLGETAEELTVFCIHDADAAGTMILQSLREASAARPGRTVNIINLGLDPKEALEMGLAVEKVDRTAKRAPVADYIPSEWRDWLQKNRVELNAMTTPQFIAWLNAKMEHYTGKVVPPDEVLANRLEREAKGAIREKIAARVLAEARVDDRAAEAFEIIKPTIPPDLKPIVAQDLEQNPADLWAVPVARIAGQLADRAVSA